MMLPTNLPDPPGRKAQESRDNLLSAILVFGKIALFIGFAIIVWSWLAS